MNSPDDNIIQYRMAELRRQLSSEIITAIVGYIRNGATDEQIYLMTTNVQIQNILLIREALKRNLL